MLPFLSLLFSSLLPYHFSLLVKSSLLVSPSSLLFSSSSLLLLFSYKHYFTPTLIHHIFLLVLYLFKMATYINHDITKDLPSRETFGLLEGKNVLYKGNHCTNQREFRQGADSSCDVCSESCNKPSSIKLGMFPSSCRSLPLSFYLPPLSLFSTLFFPFPPLLPLPCFP